MLSSFTLQTPKKVAKRATVMATIEFKRLFALSFAPSSSDSTESIGLISISN